jgi:hypothetical protein
MASKSTLLIPILEELLVKEIGEANIPPLKWGKNSLYEYRFKIPIEGDEVKVRVDFEFIEDETFKQFLLPPKYKKLDYMFNVGCVVGGAEKQFTKTNLKTLLTILSTVVDTIKDFIKNEPNLDGLYIRPTEKETNKLQKSPLYKAFIKKQLEQIPNYSYDTYRDGFILVKNRNK